MCDVVYFKYVVVLVPREIKKYDNITLCIARRHISSSIGWLFSPFNVFKHDVRRGKCLPIDYFITFYSDVLI